MSIKASLARSQSTVRVKRTFTHVKEQLTKWGYTFQSDTPLKDTSIYETIGPYGSHVFINIYPVPDDKIVKKTSAVSDLQSAMIVADKCCRHLVGYVILHKNATVIKTVGGTKQFLPAVSGTILRIVPLLSIDEIEADNYNSALNADKASTEIFDHMIVQVCDQMEQCDSEHVQAMEAASAYFHKQSSILDNLVSGVREARSHMLAEPQGKHSHSIHTHITALEQLHDHSITIERTREHMRKITESFRRMHDEFDPLS